MKAYLIRITQRCLHLTKTFFVMALCAFVGDLPSALALQVRLGQSLYVRTYEQNKISSRSVLRAGSVVDIPEAFRVANSDGTPNAERTLNNWLKHAGQMGQRRQTQGNPGLYTFDGSRLDYYYPVRVIKAAPGSTIKPGSENVYLMAVSMLARRKAGTEMTVTEDAQVDVQTPRRDQVSTEAQGQCEDGSCLNREQNSPAVDYLVQELTPALKQANWMRHRFGKRTSEDFKHLESNFRTSCGFSMEEFVPMVRQRALARGVPAEIMLSIMVQESSGRCYATGVNVATHDDHGLFQVSTGSSPYRTCTAAEIKTLKKTPVSALHKGPACLQNPVINLEESIRILKSKMTRLTQPALNCRFESGGKNYQLRGFDKRRLVDHQGRYTPDAWRLATSAYNGGECWVALAKDDLETFNSLHKTKMSAYRWDDLRVFYLRRWLDRGAGTESRLFGRHRPGRRDTAFLNLAYAENVVPSNRSQKTGFTTVGDLWRGYIHRL